MVLASHGSPPSVIMLHESGKTAQREREKKKKEWRTLREEKSLSENSNTEKSGISEKP